MPCSPTDPPPIPVSRTSRLPEGLPLAHTPKAPVPVQRSGPPSPARPRPPKAERPLACVVQQFAAMPNAASWARRHTADIVARWGVPELIDDCCTVVSELVSNAVRHAAPDDRPAVCRLVLTLLTEGVSIEVWDPLGDEDICVREVDALSESGRGLAIVAALCGASPVIFAVPGDGKAVVAVVPYSA